HAADAHLAKLGDAVLHPALDDILQVNNAQQALAIAHCKWRPAVSRDSVARFFDQFRYLSAAFNHEFDDGVGGALAELASLEIDAAHSRVRRKRNECSLTFRNVPPPQAVLLFSQNYDGSALRCLVRKTGQLGGVRQVEAGNAFHWEELHG